MRGDNTNGGGGHGSGAPNNAGRTPEAASFSPIPEPPRKAAEPLSKFKQDYSRVSKLLQDQTAVMGHLGSLEESLRGGKSLKNALYQAEQDHKFNPQVHRIGGLLHPHEFMGMVDEGLMFKDRGAAADHGENTHRLQWYVVGRDMRANPQDYKAKDASELYKEIARHHSYGETDVIDWNETFDSARGGFREPEVLHGFLRTQTQLPHLRAALTHEAEKRARLGPVFEKFGKGEDRDTAIQKHIDDERAAGRPLSDEARTSLEQLKAPGYKPRPRSENDQPKTRNVPFKPLMPGSRS